MSIALTAGRLPRVTPTALMWAGGVLLLALLWLLMISGQLSALAAVLFLGALLLISLRNKPLAILLTFAYLIFLGDIRRVISVAAGQPAFDPLLLVGPCMGTILALPSLLNLRLQENLSKAMLALLAVMALEVFNPAQGGLAIGVSGAFFYMVPIFWFWVGRNLGCPDLVEKLLYRIILPLAVLAALLGLCQTFIGFLPYQQAWINVMSRVYTSLYVGSSVRPFGFSVSAAEYATLLEFSIAAIIAAFFAKRRAWMFALPFLVTALVLESGRGLMIRLAVSLAVIGVLRNGKSVRPATMLKLGAFGTLSLLGLSFVASHFAPSPSTNSRSGTAAQSALAHQLGGLAHPFDDRYSSAGVHSNMVLNGLIHGLTSPLGHGLGATTFAAQKFTAGQLPGSSELDFSDMFTALGVLGGLLYVAIAVLVIRSALHYLRTVPLRISLPLFAILISTLGAWLIGGQYSTCSILLFLIGALVFRENEIASELAWSSRRNASRTVA